MSAGDQYLRLGDMLLRKGLLNRRKLERGLKIAQDSKRRIGDVLIDLGYVTEEQIAQCLADQYGFELEDLAAIAPEPSALAKLTAEFALKWCILPLEDGFKFRCVVSDPVNVELTDMVTMLARKPLSLTIAPRNALLAAIRSAYGLPALKTPPKFRRKRPPEPESVLQRDRSMLLEAMNFEFEAEGSARRAS